jgi:hypothetical protein
MVNLVKLPGNNGCYCDKEIGPRLLVRPFVDPPTGQPSWEAQADALRQAIIAFLAPGASVELASQALDDLHEIASTAPENSAAKRLLFFGEGNSEIGFVHADRLGNIELRDGSFGSIGIGSDFRLAFSSAKLSFGGISARISNGGKVAATFAQNGATSQGVVVHAVDIDLLDGAGLQGVLRFEGLAATLDDTSNARSSLDIYTALRLGIRVNRLAGPGATEVVRSVSSAVIHAGDDFTAIGSLRGQLDPFDHYDPKRCFLRVLPAGFAADAETAANATLTLANGTALGHEVRLRPVGGEWLADHAPKFIFSRHPKTGGGLASGLYDDAFTLDGDYEVLVAATEGAGNPSPATVGITAGFSASEALLPATSVTEAAGPLIVSFRAGPAIDPTPRDANGMPKKATPSDGPLLGRGKDNPAAHEGVTTWMKVHRGDGRMLLSAEPPDGRRLRETAAGVFEHRPILRGARPMGAADGLDGFLPVLPPRGVRSDLRRTAAGVDRQLLARERYHRTAIDQNARAEEILPASEPATMDVGAPSPDTTPLGFEIESHDGNVTAIVFARVEMTGETPTTLTFALSGSREGEKPAPLDEKVVDALTRNKLFLVANAFNAEMAENLHLRSDIGIAGWRFSLAIPATNAPSVDNPFVQPFLIVKNFAGQSIVDLVADSAQWCKPDLFLKLPPAGDQSDPVSFNRKTLNAFIRTTTDNAAKTDDPAAGAYGELLTSILRNPDWQGVLLIDLGLQLGDLPLQIKGLLGGIDTKRLKAHYLAIPMKALATAKAKPVSRLHALIDYKSENDKPKLQADESEGAGEGSEPEVFGYDVQRLVVVFANGQIANFHALVRFVAKRLFHLSGAYQVRENKQGDWKNPHEGNQLKPDAVALRLIGRYTRKNEGGKVVESYAFETADEYRYVALKKDGNGQFAVDENAIIKTVTLSHLVYETIGDDKEAGTIDSAFKIDGDIEIGKLTIGSWPDLFDISAVPFKDLRISSLLKFEGDLPKIKEFRFNLGSIGLDFGGAKRRAATRGFWSSFPLKFRKLWLFDGKPNLPKLGYFSFDGVPDLDCKFGFEFDLDLGSLGKLASMKSLRLGLLLGFSGGNAPRFTLGFRFPDGDGTLDIGIQGVLKLTAERYGIIDHSYTPQGGAAINAKFIYAVNAKLDILGYKFPPDPGMTAAIFVDPTKLAQENQRSDAVGWFAAFAPKDKEVVSGFDLDLVALGQRVDPIAEQTPPKTTLDFVGKVKKLTTEGFSDPPKDGEDPKKHALDQVLKALTVEKIIAFDPSRDWSIGFSALFADRVRLAFAMRDPDIYGLYVGLFWSKPKTEIDADKPFFSIDILYRRLSERLGVYSTEIVLPEYLRQIDFGAVTIDLPKIGLEIFTDGGFTVDLGFPWNKDFSRAFGVQILPFIGSGGFYFRKVSGPAAFLVPKEVGYTAASGGPIVFNETVLRYDPVFEAGVGFRVGLGKEINKSMFRAGLSLTVFGTLEGGVGTLKRTDAFFANGYVTPARDTFIAVRGVVGILGEVYGYVDFGIVKAGVSIRLWVATGFDFKTDFRTKLYLEVGVSVGVEVVIARIRIFRKTIEIKISFSFATTVEFSTYIGSDRNPDYYRLSPAETANALSSEAALAFATEATPTLDWTRDLKPEQWRAGSAGALEIPVYFSPDITFAQDGARMVPAFVALLTAPLPKDRADIDEFAGLLAAWAYAAYFGLPAAGESMREALVDATKLDELARAIAVGPDGSAAGGASAAARRAHLPKASDLLRLFAANVKSTVSEPPQVGDGAPTREAGVFWPMPPRSRLTIGPSGDPTSETIDFEAKKVVDDSFRAEVDEQMRRMMALLAASSRETAAAMDVAPAAISIVESVFEEHAILVMRAVLAELTRHAQRRTDAGEKNLELGLLLDDLAGRDILGSATRLFLHGPRLPFPALATDDAALVPPGVVEDPNAHHSLYRLAWLQHPLATANVPTLTLSPGGVGSVEVAAADDSHVALTAMTALGAKPPILGASTFEVERIRRVSRRFHAGRAMAIAPTGEERSAVVMLDAEIIDALAAKPGVRAADLRLRPLPATAGENLAKASPQNEEWLAADPAICVRLRIKPITGPGGSGQLDMFELRGMSEADRLRLDMFEDGKKRDRIGQIRLFAFDGAAAPLRPLDIGAATVVQVDASAEPKPDDVKELAMEALSVAKTYVAGVDDKPSFLEIIRRTAIVNRGGTLLGWHGASGANGFNRGQKPGEQFEAFLVITIVGEPAEGTLDVPVNAMVAKAKDSTQALDRLEAVFVGDSDRSTQTAEPVTEAGVLSVAVKRDPGAAPAGVAPELWEETLARFSMFAPSLTTEDGKILVAAGRSLAVGPTRFDSDAPGSERFRVALPVAKLLNGETRSPYASVGDTLLFNGVWRDVYGNDWHGAAFASAQKIHLHYSDRIVPFTDLPGLDLTWWPVASSGKPTIRFRLAPRWAESLLPKPEAGQTEPAVIGLETAKVLRERLERVHAIYRRAAWQSKDANVTLSMESGASAENPPWSNGPTLAADAKDKVAVFLWEIANAIDKVEREINANLTPEQARTKIADVLKPIASLELALDATPAAHAFVELRLAIRTERNAKRSDGADLRDPNATDDMIKVSVPVPLALSPTFRDRTNPGPKPPFGGDMIDLQAAVEMAFGKDRLLATGLSSKPSIGEGAVWLVDRAIFPAVDCFTTDKHTVEMFALPPVSTQLHSFGSVAIPLFDPDKADKTESTPFRAVDADQAAAAALGTFEDTLAPDILATLLAKPGATGDLAAVRNAIQAMITAKAGTNDDGIASLLAEKLAALENGAAQPSRPIKKVIEDRILGSLRMAERLDALVVLTEKVPSGAHTSRADESGPVAFGAFAPKNASDVEFRPENTSNVEFRPAVMPIGPGRPRRLVLTVDATPDAAPDNAILEGRFQVTHVQRLDRLDSAPAGAEGRYRPTAWLKLFRADPKTANAHELADYPIDPSRVPLVKKRYPTPPTIFETLVDRQKVAGFGTDVRKWNSERTWSSEADSRDELEVTLRYNATSTDDVGSAGADAGKAAGAAWVKAFLVYRGAVGPLVRALRGGEVTASAPKLAEFLAARATELRAAMAARTVEKESVKTNVLDKFTFKETRSAPDAPRTIEVDRKPGQLVANTTAKLFQIRASDGGRGLLKDLKTDTKATIADVKGDQPLPTRVLAINGADILTVRTVITELRLTRNRMLAGVPLADAFVYTLPTIAPGAKLAPSILIDKTEIKGPPKPIEAHIGWIIEQLVGGSALPPDDLAGSLAGLGLDVILTFEPKLADDVDGQGDGVHVAGLSASDLSARTNAGRPWLEPFQARAAAWRAAANPRDGDYVFDVRLFETEASIGESGEKDSHRLLLRIKRLVLPWGLVT